MDLYQEITDRMIAMMENGVIPWVKPWTGSRDGAISHLTGKPYSILNQWLLGRPGEWITFNQARKEGGNVRKGSKSRMVVFYKFHHAQAKNADGSPVLDGNGHPVIKMFPMLQYYNVFHIDDCDGIKARFEEEPPDSQVQPIEAAEKILNAYWERSKVGHQNVKGNTACYSPVMDEITLPLFEQFETAEGYYDTAFHESIHSTGHRKRLDRFSLDAAPAMFGSESYSKEELVAEIGACALNRIAGIETEQTFRNNTAYVQNWLHALKNDKRLIVSAASKADKAVALILGEERATE